MQRALIVIAILAASMPAAAEAPARSKAVLAAFQRANPCPIYGDTPQGRRGPCPGFVKDHIVPLCAGGADAVENLQWQWRPESYLKDVEERATCRRAKAPATGR